jgi:RimJ/RimL family protein N-acetyltransferase
LRLPDDADLAALADVVRAGVHDPAVMPFMVPWSDAAPDERARAVLQYHWGRWATWTPTRWFLELVVVRAGVVVGVQAMRADEFAARRSVATGSYLGLAHQGQGTGKLMRHAVLHLAFAGLAAHEARSEALDGNDASHAVSRALGYAEVGTEIASPRVTAVTATRYVLTRERWAAAERPAVVIEGLDPCRGLFGIDE